MRFVLCHSSYSFVDDHHIGHRRPTEYDDILLSDQQHTTSDSAFVLILQVAFVKILSPFKVDLKLLHATYYF